MTTADTRPSRRKPAAARRHPVEIHVPYLNAEQTEVPRERVRALRRHLIEAMRELRVAKHPERLIQTETPSPEGFDAVVAREGCTRCQGFCCKGGGDHAYIDERTMARVRRDHPALDASGIIRLYIDSLPATSCAGSCLFHGPTGCTLARPLRAELCNSYFCTGLYDFLNWEEMPDGVVVVASRNHLGSRSKVLRPPPTEDQRDD